MATKYFRIVGYHPQDDFCFIMDANGLFEEIWQFSSYLVLRGLNVLEVSSDEQFLDGNIEKIEEDKNQMFLRANAKGKPVYTEKMINGVMKKVVTVGDKSYVPKRN